MRSIVARTPGRLRTSGARAADTASIFTLRSAAERGEALIGDKASGWSAGGTVRASPRPIKIPTSRFGGQAANANRPRQLQLPHCRAESTFRMSRSSASSTGRPVAASRRPA
jgi:hypothetical protein